MEFDALFDKDFFENIDLSDNEVKKLGNCTMLKR
jgi:hypothetical protein